MELDDEDVLELLDSVVDEVLDSVVDEELDSVELDDELLDSVVDDELDELDEHCPTECEPWPLPPYGGGDPLWPSASHGGCDGGGLGVPLPPPPLPPPPCARATPGAAASAAARTAAAMLSDLCTGNSTFRGEPRQRERRSRGGPEPPDSRIM